MLFSFRGVVVLAAAAIFLSGCATPVQQRIDLADNYFASGKAKQGKIGVVMVEPAQTRHCIPGGQLPSLSWCSKWHAFFTQQRGANL